METKLQVYIRVKNGDPDNSGKFIIKNDKNEYIEIENS